MEFVTEQAKQMREENHPLAPSLSKEGGLEIIPWPPL